MTRSWVARVVGLAALVAMLVPAAPASAGHDWTVGGSYQGVRMKISSPGPDDPKVVVRFHRWGGEGDRQVRIGERFYKKEEGKSSKWRYTRPRNIEVGETLDLVSRDKLPCRPKTRALQIAVWMRVRAEGGSWGEWQDYLYVTQSNREC